MNQAVESFMREGLTRYAEARHAVDFFESHVFQLLQDEVGVALRDGPLARREPLDRRRQPGGSGSMWYLSLFENVAREGQNARLEVGVWWGAPVGSTRIPGAIAYANLRDADALLLKFAPPEIVGGGVLRDAKSTRLYVKVSERADLAEAVRDVLAALILGVATAPTPPPTASPDRPGRITPPVPARETTAAPAQPDGGAPEGPADAPG